MANHGPSYGLSREMQLKNQSRFLLHEAQKTLQWIQSCTGVAFEKDPGEMKGERDVCNALRDGTQLCRLVNALYGDAKEIRYVKNPKMPFHMMENISNFLTGIKKYGVPEISCFQTVDLYEQKQLYKVIECLRALAAMAQKKHAPVPIPDWAVKMSRENKRGFSDAVLNQSQTVFSLQYGSNKGASQKGMTPYGAARQIIPEHSNGTTNQ